MTEIMPEQPVTAPDTTDYGTPPRRTVEPDAMARLADSIGELRRAVATMQKAATLRNASISGSDGLRILADDGTVKAWLKPDGTITVMDDAGQPVVRMGDMSETGPEPYGIEVRVSGGSWIQLGNQNVTWASIGNKPATFAPTLPIPGTGISGTVASATSASVAQQAEGSQYAWSNNVGGTEWYAVYVGNNGGYKFGRNTSSIRYKYNVRDAADEYPPEQTLKLRLRRFDRHDEQELVPPAVGYGPENRLTIPGRKDELGLIAEEVEPLVPSLVQYFDGKVDGVAYERMGLPLLALAQYQQERILDLEQRLAKLEGKTP
ncbi:minor tail protein [Arthrobacter phage Shambre1]|uniref:Minor tail protein n=1 Tax=Arthrobacter phage Shambre1 TaxID=2927284 RepID=A0A977KNL7_9CAUD|nr:minor tail protein [Arthrobacter phage Shambre1]UXE04758.1 minor tail protein [Arthrobacter phage Shambre1]